MLDLNSPLRKQFGELFLGLGVIAALPLALLRSGASPAFGTIIKKWVYLTFFIVKHVGLEQSVKKTIR